MRRLRPARAWALALQSGDDGELHDLLNPVGRRSNT
jgi:hypothetical protein